MQAIGRDALADDLTLAGNAGRNARRDKCYGVVERWAAPLPTDEAMALLNLAQVPASRIYSAEDMFAAS